MKSEHLNELVRTEELNRFLEYNYHVDEKDVNEVAEEVRGHKNLHSGPENFLMNKAIIIARKAGIVKDEEFPHNHLPTMLAAIKLLEEKIPANEKLLTFKREMETLALGETSLAHTCLSYGKMKEHLTRALRLIDFSET